MSTNNIAFTAPINPGGASPKLHQDQIWAGLRLKIRSAETFVPKAIQSTTVISESTHPTTGNEIIVREVIFVEDQRKVQETSQHTSLLGPSLSSLMAAPLSTWLVRVLTGSST